MCMYQTIFNWFLFKNLLSNLSVQFYHGQHVIREETYMCILRQTGKLRIQVVQTTFFEISNGCFAANAIQQLA